MVSRLLSDKFRFWIETKISSPDFQRKMASLPILRYFVRRDAEKIYDLVAGFVYSQILFLVVRLGILQQLKGSSKSILELSKMHNISKKNMKILCDAAVAINLLRSNYKHSQFENRYFLGRLGAEILGVPGLEQMILHHEMFYRDMSKPLELLKSQSKTELSQYWPYVLSAGGKKEISSKVARVYSDLMASSQALVCQETLRLVDFGKFDVVMDVGGGNGTFLSKLGSRYRKPRLILFDLPEVVESALKVFDKDVLERTKIVSGDFDSSDLPQSATAITLNRILYDHDDDKVNKILKKVWDALPPGGCLIVSEPMSGGNKPSRSGDAYFGFYTMAMTTGQPRSISAHKKLLKLAGFRSISVPRGCQRHITSVIVAQK